MTPAERTSDWIRGQLRLISEQIFSLGIRITSWLLLGNATALVLLLKAVLEGTSCDRTALTRAAWFFVAGLICAFLGVAATYLINLFSLNLLGKVAGAVDVVATNEYYIAKLEAEGVSVDGDSPLQKGIAEAAVSMSEWQKRLSQLWVAFWFIILIYLASAVGFAVGVIEPLTSTIASKTC